MHFRPQISKSFLLFYSSFKVLQWIRNRLYSVNAQVTALLLRYRSGRAVKHSLLPHIMKDPIIANLMKSSCNTHGFSKGEIALAVAKILVRII